MRYLASKSGVTLKTGSYRIVLCRLLTDTVADVVGSPSTRADDRIAVARAEVETISAGTVAWKTAERSFDVVTVSRNAAVVSSKPALVVVCSVYSNNIIHKKQGPI